MLKVVVKYKKIGNSKFLAHLEMVRLIERIMRRINLPFEYSKGYNPRPQIAFAAPLAVGVSSEAEYFEVKLSDEFNLDKIKKIDKSYLPEGIEFLDAQLIDDNTSIMAKVITSSYVLKSPIQGFKEDDLRSQLNDFFAKEKVMWKKYRKNKPPRDVNIAALVEKAYLLNIVGGEAIFKFEVKTGSRGNLKPEIYLEKFYGFINQAYDEYATDIHRLEIFKNTDKGRKPII